MVARTAAAFTALSALSALSAAPARADDAGGTRGPVAATEHSEAPAPPSAVAELPRRAGDRARADGAVVASVEDEDTARWNAGGSSDPAHPSNRTGFHVAPRVFVETRVVSGRLPPRSRSKGVLSELAVLAQTRNHGYWPFRLCYEDGLAGKGALRGKTTLRMSIARTGRVASSHVLDKDEALARVATCLAEKTRRLSFAPAPARRVDVDVSVELSPGDVPLPERAPAQEPPPAAPAARASRLDTGAIGRALEPVRARVLGCFTEARATDPGLWGRLAFALSIDGTGKVVAADQRESHFWSRPVVECAREALLATTLPPGEGAPSDLVWAVRLGPSPTQNPAGNGQPADSLHSAVAESGSSRLPLGP